MTSPAFVDVEGALLQWLRSVPGLTGPGNPLPVGVHLQGALRNPGPGAYGLLTRVGGSDDWTVEGGSDRARISCSIFAHKRLDAATAAIAYANTLRTLGTDALPVVVAGAHIVVADNITGPTNIAEDEGAHYLVDAEIFCFPA